MSKLIQIRDVREEVRRKLKARAAREGMSLSSYLKRELEQLAQRPSLREWLESTAQLPPIPTEESSAQIIRKLRD